jgi:hypothetical protein
MQNRGCWRVMFDFAPDFPLQRPESVYIRMVKECWRLLPQSVPGISCSPLHIRGNGISGWIYADDVRLAADAVDQFRRKSTDVVRRIRGTPAAVIWEYARFSAESSETHQP